MLRRAVIVGAAATLALVALAIPALGIETGPPDPTFLPTDSTGAPGPRGDPARHGPGLALRPTTSSSCPTSGPITERQDAAAARALPGAAHEGPACRLRCRTRTVPGRNRRPRHARDEARRVEEAAQGRRPRISASSRAASGKAGAGAVQLQGGLSEAAAGAGQLGRRRHGAGRSAPARGRPCQPPAPARQKISGGSGRGARRRQRPQDRLRRGARGRGADRGRDWARRVALKDGLPLVQQMAADVGAGSQAVESANG